MSEPKLLFKYTDTDGAKKIIQNCSLKFSSPKVFNDPFDMHVSSAILGQDPAESLQHIRNNFINYLVYTPDSELTIANQNLLTGMKILRSIFLKMSEQERSILQEKLNEHAIDEEHLVRVKKSSEFCLVEFEKSLSDIGVLSLSKKKDEILMWAHYAEKYQGAVFGFKPNKDKDSVLTAAKPVQYSSGKFNLFDQPFQKLDVMRFASEKFMNFALTKNEKWRYEEEYRIWIPGIIKKGETSYYHRFYPEELAEVYLGYRMEEACKNQLISGATLLNKNVKIFNSELDDNRYELKFIRVA